MINQFHFGTTFWERLLGIIGTFEAILNPYKPINLKNFSASFVPVNNVGHSI